MELFDFGKRCDGMGWRRIYIFCVVERCKDLISLMTAVKVKKLNDFYSFIFTD